MKPFISFFTGKRFRTFTCLAILGCLPLGLTGCFKVSRDVDSLRQSVMQVIPSGWHEEIEIGVGGWVFALARGGSALLELDPDIRAALEVVRSADVGVYKFQGNSKNLNAGKILKSADDAMTKRGWERVVGVVSPGEVVAIYLPKDMNSSRLVRFCVLVLDDRQMVIASACSNLEPLLTLAMNKNPGFLSKKVAPSDL